AGLDQRGRRSAPCLSGPAPGGGARRGPRLAAAARRPRRARQARKPLIHKDAAARKTNVRKISARFPARCAPSRHNARPGSPGGDLAMSIRTVSGASGQAEERHWPPGWQERPTLAMRARGATLAVGAGAASIGLVLPGGAELEGREGSFALDAGQWLYLVRESMPA